MDVVAPPTAPATAQEAQPAASEPAEPASDLQRPELPRKPSNPAAAAAAAAASYESPLRHHHRDVSKHRQVKESLNARSEYVTSQDDGVAEHRINQYIIKQEIGRGSFGAVHLAVDQYGTEFAVKEFSKARLRKRAQSHVLRRPKQQRRRGSLMGLNSPLHRQEWQGDATSAVELIKEEIAIMKKLHHPNLVSLIEVLDDPTEDSLYMVMEMCKKGVVMRVGLDDRADPYPEDTCRYWFRDLILGIEYLHAQGVVHRDIKPDNCLVTQDDVLKVVDFGVSEMFEKDSEMLTAKSVGSPAFLPPELCVARHGDVSGKAADIWSMGVTLYCLKYGRIPFEKAGIFELYEAIKADQPDFPNETNPDFVDLMQRILEKDPAKRIKMPELRTHAWVTKAGKDPLLSEAENTADLLEPPTEAEMNAAITVNINNLMTVLRAVNKFKALTAHKRQPPAIKSILGDHSDAHFSQPPIPIRRKPVPVSAASASTALPLSTDARSQSAPSLISHAASAAAEEAPPAPPPRPVAADEPSSPPTPPPRPVLVEDPSSPDAAAAAAAAAALPTPPTPPPRPAPAEELPTSAREEASPSPSPPTPPPRPIPAEVVPAITTEAPTPVAADELATSITEAPPSSSADVPTSATEAPVSTTTTTTTTKSIPTPTTEALPSPLAKVPSTVISPEASEASPEPAPAATTEVQKPVSALTTALRASSSTSERMSQESEHRPGTLEVPTRESKSLPDTPRLVSEASSDSEEVLSQLSVSDSTEPVDVSKLPPFRPRQNWALTAAEETGRKGHARDPLENQLFLYIGPSTFAGPTDGSEYEAAAAAFDPDDDEAALIVSESPGAADMDIYETAYRDEIERILARAREEKREPNVYLTRRVDERLLAMSGRAGRFMAGAEEVATSIDYYTQFSARKAKVTEVSRALRHAAREEYEKRRQEKRLAIAQAREQRLKLSAAALAAAAESRHHSHAHAHAPPIDEKRAAASTGTELIPSPSRSSIAPPSYASGHAASASGHAASAAAAAAAVGHMSLAPHLSSMGHLASPSTWSGSGHWSGSSHWSGSTLKDRAADKGRHARNSLRGFVDNVKARSRTRREDTTGG